MKTTNRDKNKNGKTEVSKTMKYNAKKWRKTRTTQKKANWRRCTKNVTDCYSCFICVFLVFCYLYVSSLSCDFLLVFVFSHYVFLSFYFPYFLPIFVFVLFSLANKQNQTKTKKGHARETTIQISPGNMRCHTPSSLEEARGPRGRQTPKRWKGHFILRVRNWTPLVCVFRGAVVDPF